MSIENHPNFHSVQFTTAIVTSFFQCLRGGANKDNAPEIKRKVIGFVAEIEDLVNGAVGVPVELPECIEGNVLAKAISILAEGYPVELSPNELSAISHLLKRMRSHSDNGESM